MNEQLRKIAALAAEYGTIADQTDNADLAMLVFQVRAVLGLTEVEQAVGCTSHWATKGQTCLQALAGGWILADDLCPGCTRRFITALDTVDEPLTWHPAIVGRSS